MALRHPARYDRHMARGDTKAIEILGGRVILEQAAREALRKQAKAGKRGRLQQLADASPDRPIAMDLEPGDLRWTRLIRMGLPAKATRSIARSLGVSVRELALSLRLPPRTVHRRVESGAVLAPEESERSLRAARLLARAQELLGDENGRGWVLSPNRGLGGEAPIKLLDTADGFTAAMDELGRLEYGVIS